MKVQIYRILKHTKVEGPGTRYCIWFQGCSRRCNGCWAKATWEKNGGNTYNAEDILHDILSQKNIEGVTFLGGEPFEQYEALCYLSENIKKAGLSVVCFTGFKIAEIKQKFPEIIKNIDILIDGEFIQEELDYSRPWVGSKNQQYHFLSDRYDEKILEQYKNKIEVNVYKNGMIFMNGMGDFKKVTKDLKMVIKH